VTFAEFPLISEIVIVVVPPPTGSIVKPPAPCLTVRGFTLAIFMFADFARSGPVYPRSLAEIVVGDSEPKNERVFLSILIRARGPAPSSSLAPSSSATGVAAAGRTGKNVA
jgi:hypothetical protein